MDDWKKKVLEGMKLIREGCKENTDTSWLSCYECPYDEYCTAIMSRNYESPDTEWEGLK